jgi:hypothetical protein
MKKILIILICSVCFAECMNKEQRRQAEANAFYEKKIKAEKEFASRAYLITQIYIKGKKRSLATAEFPLVDYQSSSISPRIVEIRSYFDMQNNLDVTVRTHYTIKMEQTGNDWADLSSWEISDFKMY